MSESQHQAALFRWARMNELTVPELKLLHHIPNGGARAKSTAWSLKQEGVKPGVLDNFLPVPRGVYHGLYIELKNDKPKGVLSAEQKDWCAALQGNGYAVVVAYGWVQAMQAIQRYLGQERSTRPAVDGLMSADFVPSRM